MEESPIVQYWDFAFESGPQGLVSVPTAYFCKTYPCMYILSEKMILVFTYRTYFCSVIYCTLCGQNVVGYCWFCVPSMRLLSLVVNVVYVVYVVDIVHFVGSCFCWQCLWLLAMFVYVGYVYSWWKCLFMWDISFMLAMFVFFGNVFYAGKVCICWYCFFFILEMFVFDGNACLCLL